MRCNVCTYENIDPSRINCEMCNNPLRCKQARNEYWVCDKCSYKFNEIGKYVCLMCEIPLDGYIDTEGIVYTTYLKDHNTFVEIYNHNVVVYRGSCDIHHQKLLVDDCNHKLNKLLMPGIPLHEGKINKPGPTHGYSYESGWVPGQTENKQNGSPACIELSSNIHQSLMNKLGKDIIKLNSAVSKNLSIPSKFIANGVWARIYNTNNGLGYHVDPKQKEWVFIISLGCDIEFRYYKESKDCAKSLIIHSGDSVYFNGAALYHAVISIIPGTGPDWWEEEYDRVGLQMRGETIN